VRQREIEIEGERFKFKPAEKIQLFFSYRHTPGLVEEMLGAHGLRVIESVDYLLGRGRGVPVPTKCDNLARTRGCVTKSEGSVEIEVVATPL